MEVSVAQRGHRSLALITRRMLVPLHYFLKPKASHARRKNLRQDALGT